MIIQWCETPLGDLLLAADGAGLAGAWFQGQKYFPELQQGEKGDCFILQHARDWLDTYWTGHDPGPTPPLHPTGTNFQLAVWELLRKIPYGETTTYGALARTLAAGQGRAAMSAQAVGGAVGRNKLSIFIPCHRVLGADASLTGYAGGISRKAVLLALEKEKNNRTQMRPRDPKILR